MTLVKHLSYFPNYLRRFFWLPFKSDDHLCLYIKNLENSRLNPVFRYAISIWICVRTLDEYCAVDLWCTNYIRYIKLQKPNILLLFVTPWITTMKSFLFYCFPQRKKERPVQKVRVCDSPMHYGLEFQILD